MATLTKPIRRTQRPAIGSAAREVFTARELGQLVGVSPQTIRRAIEAGELKAAQSGQYGHFRISRAEAQTWWTQRGGGALLVYPAVRIERSPLSKRQENATCDTPEARAKAILEALESGDKARRNAAIIALAKSDERTVELVEDAIEAAEAAYDGPQDDMSDWRALDCEPFYDGEGKAI